ncbi:hypothetical protein RB213_010513 [Colletotrichum asianum]
MDGPRCNFRRHHITTSSSQRALPSTLQVPCVACPCTQSPSTSPRHTLVSIRHLSCTRTRSRLRQAS